MKKPILAAALIAALSVLACGCSDDNGPGTPGDDNGPGTPGEEIVPQPKANCYMVAPNSAAILIPVSRAEEAGFTVGDGFTAEIVWSDAPLSGAGSVIATLEARTVSGIKHLYVKPGAEGNAVVCVKSGGVIQWSWHIWVTEPVGSATDNVTGLTWMDRNLGAAGSTPFAGSNFNESLWVKTLGLYYQWGRKDPFPASDGTSITKTWYTPARPSGTTANPSTGSYTTLVELVRSPLGFASNYTTYTGSLPEIENNDSWGGVSGRKTIYDPCPMGWRVPPIAVGTQNVWGSNNTADWPTGWNKGRVFQGVNGTAQLNHFYPATDGRNYSFGAQTTPGYGGNYWSATPSNTSYVFSSYIKDVGGGLVYGATNRPSGLSVRCVAE